MTGKEPATTLFGELPLATDFRKVEALGYAVTLTGVLTMPYRLTGKRSAYYTLMRNAQTPTRLFLVHGASSNVRVARIRGYSWFQEKDGVLQPCR